MAGPIAGQVTQEAANTAYLAKGEEIFNRPVEGFWSQMVDQVPVDGMTLEMDAMGPSPVVNELLGSARYSALRAYARRERVRVWDTDHLTIGALQVRHDKSGLITKRLNDYLSAAANFWEKPVFDVLVGNPTGIDGVSILNDSHPNGSAGATWDNKVTVALDPSNLAAGITAMSGLLLENGEPAGIYPTHLLTTPTNEKMARDLCENALRPFPIAAAGTEAYNTDVGVAAIGNWLQGRIQAVISPRLTTTTDWLLMDLSKPGVRPLILGLADAPQAVVVDAPDSQSAIHKDEYEYYVRGRAAIGGFAPHCIYGRLG